jgi:hypothetical protein
MNLEGAITIKNIIFKYFLFKNKLQTIYRGMQWINMRKKKFIVVKTFKEKGP